MLKKIIAAMIVTLCSFNSFGYQLKVRLNGVNGSIVSNPAGLVGCGQYCSKGFSNSVKQVTLTMIPTADAFDTNSGSGWSSGCDYRPSNDKCVVNLTSDKLVVGHYKLKPRQKLSVNTIKGGQIDDAEGVVRESKTYVKGSSVSLTAVPHRGYDFDQWTNDCRGSNPKCIVYMSSNRSVGASFKVKPKTFATVSVIRLGGQGSIKTGLGLNTSCGAGCYKVPIGDVVSLYAYPVYGYKTVWGYDCQGSKNDFCMFTVKGDTSVTYAFVKK
jgi:hypothetical protein